MEQEATSSGAIVNALTVDVEDYFQVSAMEPYVERAAWDTMECRVERNVDRLLALFEARHARATFFTLGWIAQRYPQTVRRIVAAGHELASHGYAHRRANEQTRDDFLADVVEAKALLEDTAGVAVRGYRAPSFSIDKRNPWAFDALRTAGYRYSSSVYPVKHDHYGVPDAPRFPYRSTDGLVEIPISTVRTLGRNVPIGGGGWFRLLPYAVSRYAIARFNREERRPAIFYLHPWEIDPGQPRVVGVGAKSRFRHYVNLQRTEGRLDRLLADFRWDRVDRVYATEAGSVAAPLASGSGRATPSAAVA
ncbi:MAG TPA: XrtA system polysaccharide deacetylase [Burkholderiaceae bacterium]|jgi:polysaccharide deacetylase family protein (PEP-CTERM system associated)|nr:XrtA system polysaccharide deacetylase [Burkholderiaceae bacterium]